MLGPTTAFVNTLLFTPTRKVKGNQNKLTPQRLCVRMHFCYTHHCSDSIMFFVKLSIYHCNGSHIDDLPYRAT